MYAVWVEGPGHWPTTELCIYIKITNIFILSLYIRNMCPTLVTRRAHWLQPKITHGGSL